MIKIKSRSTSLTLLERDFQKRYTRSCLNTASLILKLLSLSSYHVPRSVSWHTNFNNHLRINNTFITLDHIYLYMLGIFLYIQVTTGHLCFNISKTDQTQFIINLFIIKLPVFHTSVKDTAVFCYIHVYTARCHPWYLCLFNPNIYVVTCYDIQIKPFFPLAH